MSDKHRMTTFYDEQTVLDFAHAAADHFASHPGHAVVGTDAFGPSPGEFLALRWGSHDRAVLVVRIDEDFDPVVFCDAVDEDAPMSDAMWAREHRDEAPDRPRVRMRKVVKAQPPPRNLPAEIVHLYTGREVFPGRRVIATEYDMGQWVVSSGHRVSELLPLHDAQVAVTHEMVERQGSRFLSTLDTHRGIVRQRRRENSDADAAHPARPDLSGDSGEDDPCNPGRPQPIDGTPR